MHAVVKDALTLTTIAVTYIFVAIQFRPIFGVFLTRNVILGTPLFGVLVRYRLHYMPVTKSVYQDTERLDGRLRIGDDKDDSFTYPTMFRNVYSIEVSTVDITWLQHFDRNVHTPGARSILQGRR